ncbi:hypothetical protein [Planktothricoides raciborskii]|uniref:Uncharacterized protein n=1 Tax=Planktothricoides raciborskii GIHE-MW2 TaxID=2792601 RepID=A0AAU8JBB2_9CYAN
MSRKYGNHEITKGNVLKFVEAILALAYGEISIAEDKLENTFKIEWVGKDANQLSISGETWVVTSKRTGRKEKRELGTTKKDLWILMKAYWQDEKALRLPKNQDETPVNYQKWDKNKHAQAFQDIFSCLTDLGIFTDKRKPKDIEGRTGYWRFSIKLKYNQEAANKNQQLAVIKDLVDKEFGLIEESPPLPDEKNKPENTSEPPDLKLYKALLKLDYIKQQSLFDEFVKKHQIGACLIHGSAECCPQWLMTRLIDQVPNGGPNNWEKQISFSQKTQRFSIDSIAREISKAIGISSRAIPDIAQKICELWRSQTVILIFNDTHSLEETYLEEFLKKIWQPIADLAYKKGTTCDNYGLLLFLLDFDGCTNDWEIPCTQEITPEWHPRTLIKFKKIEPITRRELSCWLEQVLCDENLPAQPTVVEKILAGSEGKHREIMKKICKNYKIELEEQELKWLKY